MVYFAEEWMSLQRGVGSAEISSREPGRLNLGDFIPVRGLIGYCERNSGNDSYNERESERFNRNLVRLVIFNSPFLPFVPSKAEVF